MKTHTILAALTRGVRRPWTRLSRWFGPTRPAGIRRPRLGLEALEDRCVPAIFNVVGTADGLAPVVQTSPDVFTAPTLRSAIQAANATAAPDTINLNVAGTYRITLAGAGEDLNLTGDFDIFAAGGNLTIQNNSNGAVAVDGSGLDRVFDINPTNSNNAATKILVTLQGFTITDGNAVNGENGGGIRDQGNTSLTLQNMVVADNVSQGAGGGITMDNTVSTPWTLSVLNSTIRNNHSGDAGGGINTKGSGRTVITNSVITGNVCPNQGAGIWLDTITVGQVEQSSILTIDKSIISNNVGFNSGQFGGGIGNAGNNTFVDGNGVVTQVGATTITNSTIANNFTGGLGGGYGDENGQGTLIVTNSTFVNNVALGDGGGIQANGPTTTINSSTVTGNAANGNGGGILVSAGTFTLNNTIVAQNTAAGMGPDINATVATGNGNFIGINDGNLTFTQGLFNQVGTPAAPLLPLLGPLQNNGGPLAGALTLSQVVPTRAPLAGSLVVDRGVNQATLVAGLTTDQRGFLRIINNSVDIGAVEFQPPATTTMLTVSPTPALVGQPVTFTATVMAQTPLSNPPTGTVTFTIDGMAQTPVNLANGVATFNVMTFTAGMHTVTATYNGDVNFTTSTATVNEMVQGIKDVTGLVMVQRIQKNKFNGTMHRFQITNMSGAAIDGPLYLVLDRLTRGILLKNATGVSKTHVTPGDPFVLLTMNPLAAGQSVMVTLKFSAKKNRMGMGLNFNTFVLAGPGVV